MEAEDGSTLEPVIQARDLSVGYGSMAVVEKLNLEVRPGEVVALLGANGAGKTTTLLGLTGVLAPSSGAVWFKGRPTKAPLHRRARAGLAYVPEERTVITELSTLDNLRLGQGGCEPALALMPALRPIGRRMGGLLSGGEQQMLLLARAIASRPVLLVCDELSLGLAPLIVSQLLDHVRRVADMGAGVILVEQKILTALEVADRGYVMNRGRIVMSASSDDLRARLDEIESHYLSVAPTSN